MGSAAGDAYFASLTPPKESEAAPTLQGASAGDRLCRLRVPVGKGAGLTANLGKLHHDDAALDKVVNKIEINQKSDGKFASDGWAPTLMQGQAAKAMRK